MIRRDCINEWYEYFKIQGHCSILFVLNAVTSPQYIISWFSDQTFYFPVSDPMQHMKDTVR